MAKREARMGQEAIRWWEIVKAKAETRKKTIFVIMAIGIIYMVVDHYVF